MILALLNKKFYSLSSIMQQYNSFITKYPEKLIAMQVGDFFEFFGQSAKTVSSILDLALGNRKGLAFTGFPIRSIDNHLPKLIRAGQEVVVCEQFKERHSNVFRRKVTRILTPGTVVEGEIVSGRGNNFLLGIYFIGGGEFAELAWIDIGTGEFYTQKNVPTEYLPNEIKKIKPNEIIANSNSKKIPAGTKLFLNEEKDCPSMLMKYLRENSIAQVDNFEPKEIMASSYLHLDPVDLKALDIFDSQSSLFSCLDILLTSSGSRLLAHRLQYPSRSLEIINSRLDEIERHLNNYKECLNLRQGLGGITDIERCLHRLLLQRATPRDLLNLSKGLVQIITLQHENLLNNGLLEILKTIDSALEPSLPLRIIEGPVIKSGYDSKLDSLRDISQDEAIETILERYQLLTGKKDLKFIPMRNGFFFEYSRSQGPIDITSNLEINFYQDSATNSKWRYRTKELDSLFIRAEQGNEEAKNYEIEIYHRLVDQLLQFRDQITVLIKWMAQTDLSTSMAYLARTRSYIRPIVTEGNDFTVEDGRHPVVEWILEKQNRPFTANDTNLNKDRSFAFVTGPNMGGKSTFLRQNALIGLMAQAGLYVPAAQALISISDSILTRIGAGDDLAADKSTFMMEMTEASRILRLATSNSLVILDELGRGTSPKEGIAIASAVARYLQQLKCKCLFATHLYSVQDHLQPEKILNLQSLGEVDEDGMFRVDHRIVEGTNHGACALGVAKIAGLPNLVLQDAQRIFNQL
jgi:DNA mismatch repair protein MutS